MRCPASIPHLVLSLFMAMGVQAQDAPELVALGEQALLSGEPKKAITHFTKAIEKDGEALAAYEGRAKAYLQLEHLDRFLLDVERVLRMDTGSFTGHLLKATYAFRGEDMNTAEHHASRAVLHAPTDKDRAEALRISGQAKAAFRMVDPAIADLEAGLAGGVEDLGAMATLAQLYDTKGRHTNALALLEALCEKDPKNIAHWSNRGHELNSLGRHDEALTVLDQGLQLDKDEPTVRNNRALALLALGRHDEALRDADRSLRGMPGNPYALRTRALVRIAKGEREKACHDLAAAKAVGGTPDLDQLIGTHCAQGAR